MLPGSSRKGTVNGRLSEAVLGLVRDRYRDRVDADLVDLNAIDIPQPAQGAGADAPVLELLNRIRRADGLFIAADEYTGGFSTQLRCLVGWAVLEGERGGGVLAGRRVAIAGAAPQGAGGLRGLPALAQLVRTTGAEVRTQNLRTGTRGTVLDEAGALLPPAARALLDGVLGWVLDADIGPAMPNDTRPPAGHGR